MVRVEATNVHALFNFLLNSKTTITTTGAHAGIPPTLVAPVAFEGGTLKALKVQYTPHSRGSYTDKLFLKLLSVGDEAGEDPVNDAK